MAKILIVEDSSVEMEAITKALEPTGHELLKAADGESGLEMAKNTKPDLLLLDIILPKMNGFQVCRDLRSDPATEGLKVVMLTSKDQDSDKFWGLRQGADEYLTKPFDPEELRKVVAKYID
ncbi:MAG: response regulator [Candidatus Coatesbacteria bacterium]|jgi:DNA-binding response OmpR family regulator|nr:response regulator [Candidatus Coatesbacteria bacterium]